MSNVVPLRQLPFTPQAEEEKPTGAQAEDERFWSVTTVIKTVGSGDRGLVEWACRRAATCALDERDVWEAMERRGMRAEAIKFIAGAQHRPRPGQTLKDADIGTAFHRAAQQWVYDWQGQGVPLEKARPVVGEPAVEALLDSFGLWLRVAQPTFEALELTVYNPTFRYAGTLDAIVSVKGSRYVLDYKTSLDPDEDGRRKRPWSDVALQLTGYRHAEFVATWRARRYEVWSRRYYLLNPGERALALPMPQVDAGAVLHVTPWHCDFYPVETGDDVWVDGFQVALDAARWAFRLSDGVVRDDLAVLLNTGTD